MADFVSNKNRETTAFTKLKVSCCTSISCTLTLKKFVHTIKMLEKNEKIEKLHYINHKRLNISIKNKVQKYDGCFDN